MSKPSASNIHYFEDDESPYESSALYQKPKNTPSVYQRPTTPIHPAIHAIFWILVGVVGLALTVGASIVAANEPVGDEWAMAFPFAYMVAAMFFFVKATR